MSALIRFLIISAAILIPWGVVRIADLEFTLVAFLKRLMLSNGLVIGLLLVPPFLLFLGVWLFEPRRKPRKRHSSNKDILIRFRG